MPVEFGTGVGGIEGCCFAKGRDQVGIQTAWEHFSWYPQPSSGNQYGRKTAKALKLQRNLGRRSKTVAGADIQLIPVIGQSPSATVSPVETRVVGGEESLSVLPW